MIEVPDFIDVEWVQKNNVWVYAYLDGKLVEDCYEANRAEGWLKAAKHDADGRIYVEPGTDEIAVETLFGEVSYVVKQAQK